MFSGESVRGRFSRSHKTSSSNYLKRYELLICPGNYPGQIKNPISAISLPAGRQERLCGEYNLFYAPLKNSRTLEEEEIIFASKLFGVSSSETVLSFSSWFARKPPFLPLVVFLLPGGRAFEEPRELPSYRPVDQTSPFPTERWLPP